VTVGHEQLSEGTKVEIIRSKFQNPNVK
jgi:hypothetical protein